MAQVAKCQFCSRTDNSIQVLCESRCLICSRCQLIPGIRQLLIECVCVDMEASKNEQHKPTYKGSCPICQCPLSFSMIQVINKFSGDGKKSSDDDSPVYFKFISIILDIQDNFI